MAPTTTGPNPHAPDLPYFATAPFGLDYFDHPHVKYVSHANLRCSPATLFEIFENEESWTRWALGIVDVELQRFDGLFHDFQVFARLLPSARAALDDIAAFLARRADRPAESAGGG